MPPKTSIHSRRKRETREGQGGQEGQEGQSRSDIDSLLFDRLDEMISELRQEMIDYIDQRFRNYLLGVQEEKENKN